MMEGYSTDPLFWSFGVRAFAYIPYRIRVVCLYAIFAYNDGIVLVCCLYQTTELLKQI